MRNEETREIVTCDHCGKEIPGRRMECPETTFTQPDLDYFHGIWMGDVGAFYTGSGRRAGRKDFCDIECLIADIRLRHAQAKQQRDFEKLGGAKK